MRPRFEVLSRALPLALSCLALPIGLGAGGGEVPPLDQEYPRLLAQSVQVSLEALKGKPNRRAADKARVAVMLIAAAAQRNLAGPDAAQRATTRDAALEVADLIREEKFDQVRRRLAELPKLKPDAKARKEKRKLLGPRLDVEDLMTQFRPAKVGGLGLEAKFDALGSKADAVTPNAQLLLDAYLTVVTAELTAEHAPRAKAADWMSWAQAMRKEALALGEAAQARDGKAAFQAVTRLNRACNRCHQAFRNN